MIFNQLSKYNYKGNTFTYFDEVANHLQIKRRVVKVLLCSEQILHWFYNVIFFSWMHLILNNPKYPPTGPSLSGIKFYGFTAWTGQSLLVK